MLATRSKYEHNYKNIKFKIIPKNGSYIVITEDGQFIKMGILEKINLEIITKKIDLDGLPTHINNICDKYYNTKNNTIEIIDFNDVNDDKKQNIINVDDDITKNITLYNHYKQFIKESIVKTQKLLINNKTNIKLFDFEKIADIVIKDFIRSNTYLKKNYPNSSINLDDNNIYVWNILLNNKDLNTNIMSQMTNNNIEYVKIKMIHHYYSYPLCPSEIVIMEPSFNDNLNNRIKNSKYLKQIKWNCSIKPYQIIDSIVRVINKFGNININNNTKKIIDESHYTGEIKGYLMAISSILLTIDDIISNAIDDVIDNDMRIINITLNNKTVIKKDKGVGYGYNGDSVWDQKEYRRMLNDRDTNLVLNFDKLIYLCNKIIDINQNATKEIGILLKCSNLYKFIINSFRTTTILEITNNATYYKNIFTLLQTLTLNNCSDIFSTTLIEDLQRLNEKSLESLKINSDNEIPKIIVNLFNGISEIVNINNTKNNSICDIKNNTKNDNIFVTEMNKYKCIYGKGLSNDGNYIYKEKNDQVNDMKSCYKRLGYEIPSLIETISISNDSIVLVYIDREKPNCMRFMINGPPKTPYENGLFIFDAYCGEQYPQTAPEFNLSNTSGLKLNPNLFEKGKICLSILGTYSGTVPHESEKWNPKMSSLSQVILSIQSQILIDQPYFNEQGLENTRDTPEGIANSKEYNDLIKLYTMKACMIDLIMHSNKYAELKNSIMAYFIHKKQSIIKNCKSWIENCCQKHKENMTKIFSELESCLDGLDSSFY